MDTQHGVVGLDDGGGNLGAAPDGEGDLGLLAVVDGEALEEQATETGTGTATNGVEKHEALETTIISQEPKSNVKTGRVQKRILHEKKITCSCQPTCECDRGPNQQFPFRWCNVHFKSAIEKNTKANLYNK